MEQVLEVSKSIWTALQTMDADQLEQLVASDALFVHMGATLSREQEIHAVTSKGIVYKQVEVLETIYQAISAVELVLNKIRLTAVVDGNEVVNTFVVTETYTKIAGTIQLVAMVYTKIVY